MHPCVGVSVGEETCLPIMTATDIATDGLGLMLTVWDFSWLPFVYSIQAHYLILKSVSLEYLDTTSFDDIFPAIITRNECFKN